MLGSEIPVELGGSLLIVWDDLHGRFFVGGNYDLFDWPELLERDNVFSSLEFPAGAWDVSRIYTTGQITMMAQYRDDGDFDVSGQLTTDDIDRLSAAVRTGRDLTYDVSGDGLLNQYDRRLWVEDLKNTHLGDANLDGMVDAADLNKLALNWQSTHATGWGQGDFTGDAIANAADLNEFALHWQAGAKSLAAENAIPEPTAIALALFCFVAFLVPRSTSTTGCCMRFRA